MTRPLRKGCDVDMAVVGMAKKPISKIHHLSARIENQLHQFAGEDASDGALYDQNGRMLIDASGRDPNAPKRKYNPLLRAGMAGGAVAGGVAIAANKDKIKAGVKAGYQSTRAGVDSGIAAARRAVPGAVEAGRTGIFRGMRGTASVMNKGGNLANKAGGIGGLGGLLKKGAKVLRKSSMKYWNAELADTLVRLERKITAAGA
jgi:hypothetical protein